MFNKIRSTFFLKQIAGFFIMNKIRLIIILKNAQQVLRLKSNLILHRTLTSNSTDKAKHGFKQVIKQVLFYRT